MRAQRLEAFSARDSWVTRAGALADRALRWMMSLQRAVNESVAVVGQATVQTAVDVPQTFLSSSEPLPGGTYRLSVSAQAASGIDASSSATIRVEIDDNGTDRGFEAIALGAGDVAGAWSTVTELRVLATGARIGYSVAVTDTDGTPLVVNLLLVVEFLPPTTRLG